MARVGCSGQVDEVRRVERGFVRHSGALEPLRLRAVTESGQTGILEVCCSLEVFGERARLASAP
jgi:hypothetical protein